MTSQQIIQDIKNYIQNNGGLYSGWYAGIATNPKQRLFNDHAVNENTDLWIYRTANSADEARNAEEQLHNLGCDGDAGGGNSTTKSVYAYKKNSHTIP